MPRIWVLPEDVIAEIDRRANKLKERAFPHNGHLHYYSGPSAAVWNLIADPKEKNHDIAIAWAKAHGAMIIDDSPIGKFLTNYKGMGTFAYFNLNPRIPARDRRDAGLRPWKHASHLLALSAHGQVTTTVNGADRGGVYYTIEYANTMEPSYLGLSASEFLDALSTPRKKEVLNINMLPFKEVLAKRDNKGTESAHVMIQLGATRMALHEALEKSDPDYIRKALNLASKEVLRSPAEAYKYFLVSQERFLIDRADQMKGTAFAENFAKHQTPIVRKQRREERLDQFTSKVLFLIETEIAMMPPSARPDFIVPSYVKARAPR